MKSLKFFVVLLLVLVCSYAFAEDEVVEGGSHILDQDSFDAGFIFGYTYSQDFFAILSGSFTSEEFEKRISDLKEFLIANNQDVEHYLSDCLVALMRKKVVGETP